VGEVSATVAFMVRLCKLEPRYDSEKCHLVFLYLFYGPDASVSAILSIQYLNIVSVPVHQSLDMLGWIHTMSRLFIRTC